MMSPSIEDRMDPQIKTYVDEARKKGLKDPTIEANLVVAGWDPKLASAALNVDESFPAPKPTTPFVSQHAPSAGPLAGSQGAPIAVVSNFTTRGLEYIIMFIALGVAATSLGFILHDTIDMLMGNSDSFYGGIVSYATSALVVSLPIFLVLFLRLKKAELGDAALLHDPSRQRAVQLTLIITFIIGIWRIISYVYSLLNAGSNTNDYSALSGTTSAVGNFLHMLITLGIAGGIFAYYWFDSHKKKD
jgi:hypothetical protein